MGYEGEIRGIKYVTIGSHIRFHRCDWQEELVGVLGIP